MAGWGGWARESRCESHREIVPSALPRGGRWAASLLEQEQVCLQPWRPPPSAVPVPTPVPDSLPGSPGLAGAQPRSADGRGPHTLEGDQAGWGARLSEPQAPHLGGGAAEARVSPVPTLWGSSSHCHPLTAGLF